MGLENIKYVYFDLDGTLVNKDWSIDQLNIDAINYLKEKKIKVGIASGRSFFLTQYAINTIHPTLPTIAMNGCVVVKNNLEVIDATFIDTNQYINIVETLGRNKINFMVYTLDGIYTTDQSIPFYNKMKREILKSKYRKMCNFIYDTNYENFKQLKALKILIYFTKEDFKQKVIDLLKDYNGVQIISSQNNLIDIFNKDTSKGDAITKVFKNNQYNLKELMVFGDNENDISMFKIADNSVCLIDGLELAKQTAKYNTNKPHNECGVGDFIFKNIK